MQKDVNEEMFVTFEDLLEVENEFVSHLITYSFAELAQMVEKQPYEYVNFYNGKPIHKILDINSLPGEAFRVYPENENIEVSNLGRIKIGDKVIEQWEDDEKGKDYLYVKIGEPEKYVYRFVAKTWCQKPMTFDSEKWCVHHISNNGYDNRPSNLVWVKMNDHSNKIHKK